MSADGDRVETAIRSYLATRGQEAQHIQPVLFSWKRLLGRGLSNLAMTYRVTAISADGAVNTYDMAYDPAGGSVLQNSGLKRFANGVWFDAR